jgi:hypothetical protein
MNHASRNEARRIVAMRIIFTLISCTLFTCDMYMCRLRHINDPVLSSLKMECIRLLFFKVIHPHCIYNIKGKGKAIQLQAWTGPEGSRRLRLPDFKTVGT